MSWRRSARAGDRGLRVLMDLVVNHTCNQHPRFQAACADLAARSATNYVWTDDPANADGTAKETWTWEETADQYYQHQFAPFQPDLNIANPSVRHEIAKTVAFWLTLGVSSFRMDAVPFLVQVVEGTGSDPGSRVFS